MDLLTNTVFPLKVAISWIMSLLLISQPGLRNNFGKSPVSIEEEFGIK